MTDVQVRNETSYRIDGERLVELVDRLRDWTSGVPGELSLAFVPDSTMSELHETYYGEPGPTDVLAFPYDEATAEIFIDPDQLLRQLDRSGNDFSREIVDVLVHALLHLEGYDHTRDDDGAHLNRQAELLERLEEETSLRVAEDLEATTS